MPVMRDRRVVRPTTDVDLKIARLMQADTIARPSGAYPPSELTNMALLSKIRGWFEESALG
jgi:hypothetical protein